MFLCFVLSQLVPQQIEGGLLVLTGMLSKEVSRKTGATMYIFPSFEASLPSVPWAYQRHRMVWSSNRSRPSTCVVQHNLRDNLEHLSEKNMDSEMPQTRPESWSRTWGGSKQTTRERCAQHVETS
eukprot:1806663-Amphidinium_carterae.2